jgi:hypothetical protein
VHCVIDAITDSVTADKSSYDTITLGNGDGDTVNAPEVLTGNSTLSNNETIILVEVTRSPSATATTRFMLEAVTR